MTNTKITYTQQGDYLLPNLELPEQPKVEIGIFGKRRLRYLEQKRKILYTNLLTKGKLTAYLADIDEQAENMFDRLVRQLAEREGVTEQLKAENQMLWVKEMNSIRNRLSGASRMSISTCLQRRRTKWVWKRRKRSWPPA